MQYWHWLLILSGVFLVLERLFPARRQSLLRPRFPRDVFYVAFNGHVFVLLLGWLHVDLAGWVARLLAPVLDLGPFVKKPLAHAHPAWAFVAALIVLDFVKYWAHVALHRLPFLWTFHRVHHSVTTMDWLGNWRFHWFEILYYGACIALPLALLSATGAPPGALFAYYVVETAVGNLNHANVRLDLGVLHRLVNGPRMHLWHHDAAPRGFEAKNFAIVLSLWDWLFGTARLPDHPPERLGFPGQEALPDSLGRQLILPLP
jgi:sterol desaturase/sphingolipid hydroxylase (fatty acid hydroxylase superfamily)